MGFPGWKSGSSGLKEHSPTARSDFTARRRSGTFSLGEGRGRELRGKEVAGTVRGQGGGRDHVSQVLSFQLTRWTMRTVAGAVLLVGAAILLSVGILIQQSVRSRDQEPLL